LDIAGLSVSLGGRPILRDLSFSLESGQVVAVVGRNGVGKTTLLRSLAGLQKHEGAIKVNGSGPDLGLVFQNADLQLFNASVREEILFRVPDPDMALYEWLLAALGLARYEQVPPLLLSEGEKKRVALATVLMRRPRHGVLLDEPSLGQDTAHKEMLIRLARSLAAAGQLVILTTHDLPLAVQADRLLLLGPEGFVADGPPARVLAGEAAWAKLGLSVPEWVHAPEAGP
jgi:energy-coupling factor transporter ATP-binding protein EcfA2